MLRTLLAKARQSSIVSNVVALYSAHLVGLLIPLVTVPYLARVLRPAGWGLVVFAQSFGAWLALILEYAFDLSGTRLVAQVRSDRAELESAVGRVQGAKLLMLTAVTAGAAIALWLVPAFRSHPRYLIWAWAFALTKGFSPFWYFLGVERMRGPARVEAGAKVLAAAGLFALVRGPEDGWVVLALQAVATALSTSLLTLWLYRDLGFRWPSVTGALRTLKESFGLFVLRTSSGAYIQANSFILGVLTTPQVVAYFGGAERIIRAAVNLLGPLSQAIYPRLSHLAAHDRARARALLRGCLFVMVGAGTAMGLVAAIEAEWLVRLFLGPGYEAAAPVLRVLSLLPPVIAVGSVFGIHWALPLGLDRPFTLLVLAAGALNVVLAVLLAPRFGALGMAVSVLLADVLVSAGLLALFWRRPRAPEGSAP